MRDECCFVLIEEMIEKALKIEWVEQGGARRGDASTDQLWRLEDILQSSYLSMQAEMDLPYSGRDTITRPFDPCLECAVQKAHKRSGKADSVVGLLDRLDDLLDDWGAPDLGEETVPMDRRMGEILWRLSRMESRIFQHRQWRWPDEGPRFLFKPFWRAAFAEDGYLPNDFV